MERCPFPCSNIIDQLKPLEHFFKSAGFHPHLISYCMLLIFILLACFDFSSIDKNTLPKFIAGMNNKTIGNAISTHLLCILDILVGHCRYCLNRSSKAWPMVLITSWANPSQHSNIWHALKTLNNSCHVSAYTWFLLN